MNLRKIPVIKLKKSKKGIQFKEVNLTLFGYDPNYAITTYIFRDPMVNQEHIKVIGNISQIKAYLSNIKELVLVKQSTSIKDKFIYSIRGLTLIATPGEVGFGNMWETTVHGELKLIHSPRSEGSNSHDYYWLVIDCGNYKFYIRRWRRLPDAYLNELRDISSLEFREKLLKAKGGSNHGPYFLDSFSC